MVQLSSDHPATYSNSTAALSCTHSRANVLPNAPHLFQPCFKRGCDSRCGPRWRTRPLFQRMVAASILLTRLGAAGKEEPLTACRYAPQEREVLDIIMAEQCQSHRLGPQYQQTSTAYLRFRSPLPFSSIKSSFSILPLASNAFILSLTEGMIRNRTESPDCVFVLIGRG